MEQEQKILIIREAGTEQSLNSWIGVDKSKLDNDNYHEILTVVEEVDVVDLQLIRDKLTADANIVWVLIFMTQIPHYIQMRDLQELTAPLTMYSKDEVVKTKRNHPYKLQSTQE